MVRVYCVEHRYKGRQQLKQQRQWPGSGSWGRLAELAEVVEVGKAAQLVRVRVRVRVLGTHHLKDGTTVIAPSTTWPCI